MFNVNVEIDRTTLKSVLKHTECEKVNSPRLTQVMNS